MKSITVTVRRPGFHRWPDAPEPVAFLRERHRHLFTFKVVWPVEADDREQEFFLGQVALLDAIVTIAPDLTLHGLEFGSRSCERLAGDVMAVLPGLGHPQPLAVEVWEDDENGARVER